MRVSPHCFAVTGLGLLPPWCVNAGIIAGDHTTLIADTGPNAFSAATIHGYASLAQPGNSLTVINLEKHFDHIGGNGYFRELGIDVFAHPLTHRTQDEFCAEITEFNNAIPNPVRRQRKEAEAFYSGTVLTNPNRTVEEETTLDLGNCTVQVLFTPGHTPTNLSLYIPEDEVLFCADCMINGYLPNLDSSTPSDWPVWIASIHRIANLRPKTVVPGHGHIGSGDDVQRMIDYVLDVLEKAIWRGCSPTADPKRVQTGQ